MKTKDKKIAGHRPASVTGQAYEKAAQGTTVTMLTKFLKKQKSTPRRIGAIIRTLKKGRNLKGYKWHVVFNEAKGKLKISNIKGGKKAA